MLHLREQTNETNNKTQVVSREYPLPIKSNRHGQPQRYGTQHPTPNTQHNLQWAGASPRLVNVSDN